MLHTTTTFHPRRTQNHGASRLAILLACGAFLMLSSLALAGDAPDEAKLTRSPRAERVVDPAVHAIFEAYQERFAELDGIAADGVRAALREEFAAELDRVLDGRIDFPGFEKSAQDCEDACDKVTTGLAQIAVAEDLADSGWLNDCPNSWRASDAYTYAHNSEYDANNAYYDICGYPVSCDLSDLTDARDKALAASQSAYDAWDIDGCGTTADDMYEAWFVALAAYNNFDDALDLMAGCCS